MRCVEEKAIVQPSNLVATVNFSDADSHPSRFGQLRLVTNAHYDDLTQMRAAGFAEGYATAERIFDHWSNTEWWLNQAVNDVQKIYDWLAEHDKWLTKKLAEVSPTSAAGLSKRKANFWAGLRLVNEQLQGVLDGYNAAVGKIHAAAAAQGAPAPDIKPLTRLQLITINSMGDMDDIIPMLFPPSLHTMTPPQLRSHLASSGHCSALIKVTGDLSDLLVGHVTWWTYTASNRIYKHWDTPLKHKHFRSPRLSFSSYPGQISSMDDFYILSSRMVVLETTNDVFDHHLYRLSTPAAALSWQRVRIAHMWAHDGPSWVSYLEMHNSGTYNNQYMVVDLKKFAPGKELEPGLLTVAEQIPGEVVWADATQELERGYWPSYNVPYFEAIYNKSGYPQLLAAAAAQGPEYEEVLAGASYQLAPRAKIFRRDAGTVTDLESLKRLLRYNNFTQDPYAAGSPWWTICSRGDLDPKAPLPDGCNDAKVTSYTLALRMAAEAVNSPPFGEDLPPFAWTGQWANYGRRGLPDTLTAEFELQQP